MKKNELYPVFLKLHELNVLIVGAGNVGYEKLSFMLKSSPNARVIVVAEEFSEEVRVLAEEHGVPLLHRPYTTNVLHKKHLVIAATNDPEVNKQICEDARERNILVNVADTPELCDLYLGGIVTKGNVKIAISTNGKSPTMAKRLRQLFEEIIPDDIDELVENLNQYRSTLRENFENKVEKLNHITKSFINKS
ncbi:precorrin-2 dehydrogenase/sirohydrochlorin ferrochelatase family protein [Sinomicrobium weinanense]|uniref:precorrin-2 dehydrogenase n=1 Tax=Sinomicrobium weinanense TaxID=2842200 RepID=A0A926JS10_9FLAO|nr:bifunctional precorrin-2 dehydrogenase/sirohydrochlorin ferrochelatase [Sinomicrobium weinanense]MBC9796197.1 bifunctional precorrin-2 dehydrogenase/sirohydrochlorin ferrochelatase [Sinomicrobium weinanense]MBU3123476.1 bifunctional precorrin-2 dehydrogenase/sirohydrochlorin ferrochelatase [Sinomicrobium weinanense]